MSVHPKVSVRTQIAALIFPMVQAVLFGIGVFTVLLSPLASKPFVSLPIMVALSFVIAVLVSWEMAPRLRLRYWKARGVEGDIISG